MSVSLLTASEIELTLVSERRIDDTTWFNHESTGFSPFFLLLTWRCGAMEIFAHTDYVN
jgi:hypothetical protein